MLQQNHSEQLTLFAEDSPASRFQVQEREGEKTTLVSSGLKCFALSNHIGQLGCLVRMLLVSSRWRSERFALGWKKKDISASHSLFQLARSAHPISGKESGLWLGTLRAQERPRSVEYAKGRTPTATEVLRSKGFGTGTLNPKWAEWFMGYPEGWTELPHSETL